MGEVCRLAVAAKREIRYQELSKTVNRYLEILSFLACGVLILTSHFLPFHFCFESHSLGFHNVFQFLLGLKCNSLFSKHILLSFAPNSEVFSTICSSIFHFYPSFSLHLPSVFNHFLCFPSVCGDGKKGFEEVLMPGEPETRCEELRRAEGVPLQEDVATWWSRWNCSW